MEKIKMVGNYDQQDCEMMRVSHLSKHKSRWQELLEFIKAAGFQKIGVANCASMQKYAQKLVEMLQEQGLDVYSINCRESGLDAAEVCEGMAGPCCDPVSQAEYLNAQHTELNINIGLCLGHGLLFQKYSQAFVTTFVVKDAVTGHNPIENLL